MAFRKHLRDLFRSYQITRDKATFPRHICHSSFEQSTFHLSSLRYTQNKIQRRKLGDQKRCFHLLQVNRRRNWCIQIGCSINNLINWFAENYHFIFENQQQERFGMGVASSIEFFNEVSEHVGTEKSLRKLFQNGWKMFHWRFIIPFISKKRVP